ncbi:MAG TPA: hypothetical protein VK178_00890 [Opitutaceae bacterium]|nr:hypothetical protein [Opitutaceae bacterium]
MARPRFYRRLTRNRSGLGTYSSLWLGPDHLLLVTSTGFSESYQRYYFRDIQALVVTDSNRFLLILAITGCLLLFLGLGALLAVASNGVSPWILLPTIPTFIVFLWNLILGRTCKVHIVTGVQTVPLPPLSRFRRTRRVFAKIVPLIEAAQASLVPPPIGDAPAAATPAVETSAPAAPEVSPELGSGAAAS